MDVVHLLKRVTFGPSPALIAEVTKAGTASWLDTQLAPATIDDSACDAIVTRFPGQVMTIPQVRASYQQGSWDVMNEVVRLSAVRQAWSRRQLLEVMVDFWSNHLNVTCPSSDVWDCRHTYDREVIRTHALGRYSDMLVASARSPAMLRYLDGATSRGTSPNENWGRELLELHTVGVSAGYTEADIRASSLLLTGRTVWNSWDGGTAETTGTFRWRPEWHYVGPLTVMGWSSANPDTGGGLAAGDAYLRHLAAHPLTARRIARKLAIRFVSDEPSDALIADLAGTYLASDTAIIPVLRRLLASAEFTASVGRKQRRPAEDLLATLRLLNVGPSPAGVDGFAMLAYKALELGHAPLGWAPPDGYPDVSSAWQSAGTLVRRWNMHVELCIGWYPRELVYPPALSLLPSPTPATCGALLDALATRLLVGPLVASTRAALLGYLGVAASDPVPSRALDWELKWLVGLMLDTPAHGAR